MCGVESWNKNKLWALCTNGSGRKTAFFLKKLTVSGHDGCGADLESKNLRRPSMEQPFGETIRKGRGGLMTGKKVMVFRTHEFERKNLEFYKVGRHESGSEGFLQKNHEAIFQWVGTKDRVLKSTL